MAFPVTLNGRTYTLTDFEGTNYVDGLPDAFEDFVTHAGDIYNSTSTTSNSIGTGSKTFTVEANKPYQAGTPLRIADAAAPSTNFLDTVVTSYSGTTLVVNSIGYGGSGTKTSWTVNIGGAKTIDGTLGVSQGGTGATTAAAARTNLDTYSKTEADSRFLNVSGEASDVSITGDLTVDTDTFVVDGTNDRVGVGTASPATLLHLNSASDTYFTIGTTNATADARIQFRNSGGTDAGGLWYATSGNSMQFRTNSAEAMRIDSSQRVLIGNGISSRGSNLNLQVEGTTFQGSSASFTRNSNDSSPPALRMTKSRGGSTGNVTIVANNDVLGQLQYQGTDGSTAYSATTISGEVDGTPGLTDMPGRLVFSTTVAGGTSPTERMRINNAGDVKIGSGDPTERLHVDGEVRVEGQLGANLYVRDEPRSISPNYGSSTGIKMNVSDRNGNGSWAAVYAKGSDAFQQGNSLYFITQTTTGSEPDFTNGNIPSDVRMTIDRSGNVGIGESSPQGRLHLKKTDTGNSPQNPAGNQLVIENGDSSGSADIQFLSASNGYNHIFFGDADDANVGVLLYDHPNNMMRFSANAGEKMRLIAQGSLQVSDTGTYRTWSSNITGNQFIQSVSGQVVLTADATNTGYTQDVVRILCSRTQSSSYEFLTCTSGNLGDDEFRLRGDGQAYADGSWNGGGADYAEYFEWADGNIENEDRVGYTVVLDGNKIRKATSSDNELNIIGAVSANPSVVGDVDMNAWKHKYLRDDFGRYIRDPHNVVEWTETVVEKDGEEREIKHSYEDWNIPDGIVVPDDATTSAQDENGNPFTHRRPNPDYNPDLEYVTREDRPEWSTIGMMGKLRIRKGQPTGSNWIKMRDVSDAVEEWLVR